MTSPLELLHLVPKESLPGLVPVSTASTLDRIEEQYVVRQAESIGGIDYVFFRRFSDGRSSLPAACVIDNGDDHFSETELAQIHWKLWLNGCTPLLYVGWQTRVDVLSCARGPDFWKNSSIKYDPADKIEIAKEISDALQSRLHRYSAYRLSDGTFWDDPDNSFLADSDKAAHQQLIRAVVETDQEIEGQRYPTLRRLLLLTVLIKYLEDRGVFPDAWFNQFHPKAESFFDLLQQGSPESVRELLSKLEHKFNGDVFELPEAEQRLTVKNLRHFADLVEGKTLKAQRYLWQQFSFKYIPVEVLSHLYQHFAQKGKGAVFTPVMLAHLMLDYAMPYDQLTGKERILDPTCGSGVFLVGAFRRLVQIWQSNNGWGRPDVATLKRIVRQSIFGVELQEEAVHLTAFSLALAICDALQPNVIWKELRFDKLVGSNLHVGDFFDCIDHLRKIAAEDGGFSTILGNPPFLSKLSDAASRSKKQANSVEAIPDKQMAYFIAEQSMSLLKENGNLCLVQPHGFLYNEKARSFQKKFISANQLEAVLDFTSIRNLYEGADPKTIAILTRKRIPVDNHRIRHLTFRRTFSVKERIAFELDHYDRHLVSQEKATRHSWVWRINLLGGGRLQNLAERMEAVPRLRAFVEGRNWDYGEGFIAATGGKREPAPWLTGQPMLPTEALTESGIDESRLTVVKATRFRSAYTKARYMGPIVMIREHESLPCTFRAEGFLAYKDKIVGIHADKSDESALKQFFGTFTANRDILRAFCLLFGTQALLGKSTAILKRDIDVLPWPGNGKGWGLSKWEKILCADVINFSAEFVRLGQNSTLLRDQASPHALDIYGRTFVEMLGSVYTNLRMVNSGMMNGLAFQAFCFGNESGSNWAEDWTDRLQEIVYRQHSDVLRTVRVLRFYERNTIVIVKPDRLRYWIPSTAVRDADETLSDLHKQGH